MSAAPLHACSGSVCAICSDARRDEGMARAEHGGAAVLGERTSWNTRFDRWIKAYATPQRGEFTNSDVRRALAEHQPPSPQMWGPAFKRAMRAGVIRRVGYTEASTVTRNGGLESVYVAGER